MFNWKIWNYLYNIIEIEEMLIIIKYLPLAHNNIKVYVSHQQAYDHKLDQNHWVLKLSFVKTVYIFL